MDYRSNFKTAFCEVFGIEEQQRSDAAPAEANTYSFNKMEGKTLDTTRNSSNFEDQPQLNSVISSDTTIIGKVISSGHIQMNGSVEGDMTTEGNIVINGKVKGNIKCANINVRSGVVTGDISASGTITIDNDTQITGSLDAADVTIDGRLKGNINSKSEVIFKKNAKV